MAKQSKTPTLKPATIEAITDYGRKLMTVKNLPPDDPARFSVEQQALKDFSISMRQSKIALTFSQDNKVNFRSANPYITLKNSSTATSKLETANRAMVAASDAKALAILGIQGDTITRYPLKPYALNLNNSASLLVINDGTGRSRGIYHVTGDQFNPRLEYKPVTTAQALELFKEEMESAKRIDLLNANNSAVTITNEQKYQDLKDKFVKNSTQIDTINPLPPGARAVQKEYWDGDKDHLSQAKQKITPEQFWEIVKSEYFDYVPGKTKLLFEQPIMLKDGARNSYTNLFVVEQDGVPKIFMATRSNIVHFEKISHELAKGLIESGLSADVAKSASEQFFSKLTEHGYFQQNASALSANAAPKNTFSAINKQRGYAYADVPEWLDTRPFTTDIKQAKQGLNNVLNSAERTMSPAILKALGPVSMGPALYEIAKQTHEARQEGVQSELNTATVGIARLDAAIIAGGMANPYALPLLVNPYGELLYVGCVTAAAIGGSQFVQAAVDIERWAWQKLAVEPLQAQADARAAEKAQQEVAQQKHLAILDQIPDTLSPEREAAQREHARIMSLIPDTPSAQQLMAIQIVKNAAKNELSIEDTCTALNAARCHFTGSAAESSQAADDSHPAPPAQESLNQ